MSYSPVRSFGATYNISTPWGKTGISVPVEQIAQNTVDAAWPPLEQRLQGALPGLVKTATDHAIPAFKAQLPYLMDLAIAETQPELRKELDRTMEIATTRAVAAATGMALVIIGAAWWTRRAVKKGR